MEFGRTSAPRASRACATAGDATRVKVHWRRPARLCAPTPTEHPGVEHPHHDRAPISLSHHAETRPRSRAAKRPSCVRAVTIADGAGQRAPSSQRAERNQRCPECIATASRTRPALRTADRPKAY
ncbi:hypothetical protein AcV5_003563 [Taiwanofungus camphoratus]|nr:hypothetical protein AcV5_003563 [Antrodia cinnamomea]